VDEEDTPKERVPRTHPRKEGSETHRPTAERETSPALPFAGDSPFSDVAPPQQETPPTPPRREQTPQPTTRQLKRSKKVPRREGNVYGETCHPVEILQGKEKEWRQIEGSVLGDCRTLPQPSAPEPGPSQPPQPWSLMPSEREIEHRLAPDDNEDEFWKNMGMHICPAG